MVHVHDVRRKHRAQKAGGCRFAGGGKAVHRHAQPPAGRKARGARVHGGGQRRKAGRRAGQHAVVRRISQPVALRMARHAAACGAPARDGPGRLLRGEGQRDALRQCGQRVQRRGRTTPSRPRAAARWPKAQTGAPACRPKGPAPCRRQRHAARGGGPAQRFAQRRGSVRRHRRALGDERRERLGLARAEMRRAEGGLVAQLDGRRRPPSAGSAACVPPMCAPAPRAQRRSCARPARPRARAASRWPARGRAAPRWPARR